MVVASALASVCFRVPFVLSPNMYCNVFCWTHAAALQRARHRQADRKSLCDKVGVLDKFISLVFFALLLPPTSSQQMANIVCLKVSLEQTAWVLGHHFKSRCGFLNLNVRLGQLRPWPVRGWQPMATWSLIPCEGGD